MFRNYFKVALRNINKYRFYSAINILGMTTGIAACLLIVLWVTDEVSYDRFHKDADRMYVVGLNGRISGQNIRVSNTCTPLAPTLVAEVPEVEEATRVIPFYGEPSIKFDDKSFLEEKVFFADSNFFEFFTFELLHGDTRTVLKEPNMVVLTSETAIKYFGDETSALGKLITINDDKNTYKVTGVAANTPGNSHFGFNMLISSESNERVRNGIWLNNWMFTYFKTRPNTSVKDVEAKFPGIIEKYVGPEVERYMGISMKGMKEKGDEYGFFTTLVTDIHLRSTTTGEIEPSGNLTHVYFFSGIGIFILIIACINFMNLSTARSSGRAKEVGLRKTLGSMRGQMVGQFLAESTIYSFVSVLLAVLLCFALLPSFNLLSGKELNMVTFASPYFVLAMVGLILFVGLLAGSYPAFYLTSFSPVEVLKGKVRAGMRSKGVRSSLVVLQFFISIFLIIFTAVVFQQIRFMENKNMGLDKENILILENTWRLGENKEAFRNTLSHQNGILKMSYTNNTFPGVSNTTVFRSNDSDQDHIMGVYFADYDHLDVMKFELKEGRYFSKDFPSDSTAIMLNEAAAKEFGYTNPIGEEIIYNSPEGQERLKVIGIIRDFNFESFKEKIRPISIRLVQNENNLMVRYQGNAKDIVEKAEKIWKDQAANQPFEYTFLDQEFDELFRSEQRMGKIFTVFSALAIFIACLGLFALAAFTSEQRTKEIGIRKALGASSANLTLILSREFTQLVLIAFIPASAVAWYISDQWLSGFAHRISINFWIFLASGAGAILIAWLTVSYQAIRAASSNPVDSLRYE